MFALRCAALVPAVLFIFCLSIQCQITRCQTNANNNQAVSPPPSFFQWLQPFRPIITVSKFPPIIEYIAQRIQAQFSNYIYEDLSRPPTYDRPTYKPYISPDSTTTTTTTTIEEDITTTAEPLVIPTVAPPKLVLVDSYDLITTTSLNQSIEIEYQLKKIVQLNQTNENIPQMENNVHLIMQHNNLKENVTQIFGQKEQNNDYKSEKQNIYKDISNIFTNNINDELAKSLLRDNTIFQNVQCHLIALTKIRKHVYVNVINLKNNEMT